MDVPRCKAPPPPPPQQVLPPALPARERRPISPGWTLRTDTCANVQPHFHKQTHSHPLIHVPCSSLQHTPQPPHPSTHAPPHAHLNHSHNNNNNNNVTANNSVPMLKHAPVPSRWRTNRPILSGVILPQQTAPHSTAQSTPQQFRPLTRHPQIWRAQPTTAPVHTPRLPPQSVSYGAELNRHAGSNRHTHSRHTASSSIDSRLRPERASSEPFEALRRERIHNINNDYVDGPTLASTPLRHHIDSGGRITNLCSSPEDIISAGETHASNATTTQPSPRLSTSYLDPGLLKKPRDPAHAPSASSSCSSSSTRSSRVNNANDPVIDASSCEACRLCHTCEAHESSGCSCCPAYRVVDALSCLCAVQTVLYHCNGDDSTRKLYVDDPCSCTGSSGSVLRRWTCMVLSSVTCLPCLCAYWPLRTASQAMSSTANDSDDARHSRPPYPQQSSQYHRCTCSSPESSLELMQQQR